MRRKGVYEMNKVKRAFDIVKKKGVTPFRACAIGGFIVVVEVEEGRPYDCMKRVDILFKTVDNLFPTVEKIGELQKMKYVRYKEG